MAFSCLSQRQFMIMQCLGAKSSHSFCPVALPGVALAKEGIQCFIDFGFGGPSLGCMCQSVTCNWCSYVGSFPCATIQRILSAHGTEGGQWRAQPRAAGRIRLLVVAGEFWLDRRAQEREVNPGQKAVGCPGRRTWQQAWLVSEDSSGFFF